MRRGGLADGRLVVSAMGPGFTAQFVSIATADA